MKQEFEMTLIELIRKRPVMYVGSTSIKGFNTLLKTLVKNFFEAANTDYFSFELLGELKGRLIFKNSDKNFSDTAALNFWRKYEDDFQGFELATLNALSRKFELKVFDNNNNELFRQLFEKGELQQGEIKNQTYEAGSFEITFDLDNSIFETSEPLNADFYLEEIRNLAYLYKNKLLAFIYTVANEACKAVFKFENGLKDKIAVVKLKGFWSSYFDTYVETKFDGFAVEAAFCFREAPVDESYLISYVNNHHTHEDGTHVKALLKGIIDGMEKYIRNRELKERYVISEKCVKETLLAAIHIKFEHPFDGDMPLFRGSTKNKLVTKRIILPISKHISEVFLQKMEKDEKKSEYLLRCFRKFD